MVEEKIFNAGCICSFKDRFRSFRFVAEADALIPAEHQQRNLPFSEDQQGMKFSNEQPQSGDLRQLGY